MFPRAGENDPKVAGVMHNGAQGRDVGGGGPATEARLSRLRSVAVDSLGNVYIADTNNHRVRKVSPDGLISTVAGNGQPAFGGDGGPPASAQLNKPSGVALDVVGNLYVADTNNNRLRKVTPDGTLHTIAGTGGFAYNRDGIDATSATLGFPHYVAVDDFGNVYISDGWNNRIRKLVPK